MINLKSAGSRRTVIANILTGEIQVSSKIQLRNWVYFQINTFLKGIKPLSSKLCIQQYHNCLSTRMVLLVN